MIIQRYINLEIFYRLIWITVLLTLIFTTNKFVDYLADAAAGKIPSQYVFSLLWHRILAMQAEVMPLLVFLAMILAFARLNQDNELAVLGAAGMGKKFQIKVALKFCLVYSILLAYVAFFAEPWAKMQLEVLKTQAWKDASITALTSGKFKELDNGKSVVYVEHLSDDNKLMKNVFLQTPDKGKDSVLRADTAYLKYDQDSGNRFIIFENGRRYEGEPGWADYQITQYARYGALIETQPERDNTGNIEAMSTADLLVTDSSHAVAELQWRLSSIIASFVLCCLAVLLNQYPFSQKPFTLLLIGILIYFIYNNLLSISDALVLRDKLPGYIGLWWVHLLAIAITVAIYRVSVFAAKRKMNGDVEVLARDA